MESVDMGDTSATTVRKSLLDEVIQNTRRCALLNAAG